ncbi:thermonuclease family protein [Ramlibacter sp. AN1015]|uniref:thermonuclease family protein n=1 Tax=Ramlibacter sp. AN1015 TaxID=3133428 RepID=UPI0030BADFF6
MPPSTISPDSGPRRRVLLRLHTAAGLLPLLLLLLALSFGAAGDAAAAQRVLRGTVSHVTDGDSIWVRPARGGAARPVRLLGIDAPELCQRGGAAAREALARGVLGRPVLLHTRGRDAYQRVLAQVGTEGQPDVGAWLVAHGHAWAAARGPASRYAAQERQARAARRGVWARPGAIEPRAFRARYGSCR